MKIELPPGKYVVAVSGGVDSVALLNLLQHKPSISKDSPWKWRVAHYDHGIRADSYKDRVFVGELAQKYDLEFYYAEGKLGAGASEATARQSRYKFLNKIKQQTGARAIITAHQQDDVVETALINLLRGTKAKGLGSLKSTDEIIRPLLRYPKKEIISYAKTEKLDWREDPTNLDQNYLRNYVRLSLLPKLSQKNRQRILDIISSSVKTTTEITEILETIIPKNNQLKRSDFISLPHQVAGELVAGWLRRNDLSVDQKTVQRLVVGLKSLRSGAKLDINNNFHFLIENGIIRVQKGD